MSGGLKEPLERLPGLRLNKRERRALATLGCLAVGDLLLHLPRRYEDRRRFDAFPNQPMDRAVCLLGVVVDVGTRFAGRRRFFEARLENPDPGPFEGSVVCRWFQMPWIQKVLAVGQQMVFYGKPKESGRQLVMDHPEFEVVDEGSAGGVSLHLGRVTPIYPLTSGIGQRVLRESIHFLFRHFESDREDVFEDLLPAGSGGLSGRREALLRVHFPEALEAATEARRYLALEEFYQIQLTVLRRRAAYRRHHGEPHCGEGKLLERCLARLPFSPTRAQRRAIEEIRKDLGASHPMNRLLQGDVGSGKTLVATAAILLAVEAGFQAAFMAPTQILAEQHYRVLVEILEPLGVRVALRTSERTEDGFLPLMAGDEEPQVLVGTHALLYDKVTVADRFGLVVIDEQHKFGVAQRGRLMERATRPDVLVMTATPIPRTLTMTVYGDLDVSVLDEGPSGRGKIITAVRSTEKTPEAAVFLREEIAKGRQAYIVYPLKEESQKLKLANATQAFEEWRERLGEGVVVGLLHGRLSGEEKESVMARFRTNQIQVLVSTTVVEVGVDVPNASVLLVYHAERFGLAQLHQLRGRIGRGEHKSYCVFMHPLGNREAAEKLAILAETRDGFKIAEADLARRGPGDLLGTAQSGLPDLRMVEFLTDTALVEEARRLAVQTLSEDPRLERPEHAALRQALRDRVADEVPIG